MTLRPVVASLAGVLLLGIIGAVSVIVLQYVHDPGSAIASVAVADRSGQIERGRALALAANCMGCHTKRGGAAYAGGRVIPTPFGELYSPNITADPTDGIGAWSADAFWRALHNGKSRDGRFLYPAFPYTDYTKISRPDADAMYAFFQTVTPVAQANLAPALRFPFNQRFLLAGWRALYFRPGVFQADPARSVQWNRGAYLVQGAGHCNACHANRNMVGATGNGTDLAGGLIPVLGWYAPSLTSSQESGLGNWSTRDIVDLLRTGVSARGAVFGPMAEVVSGSLQHIAESDLTAMAVYLQSLPATAPGDGVVQALALTDTEQRLQQRGATLYRDQCAACHQEDGRGAPPAYPPLAGNQAITTVSSINAIRMVLNGGYPPATTGNPRPYGMPPFGPVLNDDDVAAVVTYVRSAWGNRAVPVSAPEVRRYRAAPAE